MQRVASRTIRIRNSEVGLGLGSISSQRHKLIYPPLKPWFDLFPLQSILTSHSQNPDLRLNNRIIKRKETQRRKKKKMKHPWRFLLFRIYPDLSEFPQCPSPDAARRFFDWVLETDGERLSSKSYNQMLGILGVNGLVEEFWDLVDVMKKKGYGISGGVRDRVAVKFEKEGLENDLERLRGVFASGSVDNSMEKVCSRGCKIIRSDLWGDDVEKRLRDLNVTFSNDLVKMHDEHSYNAIARALGREDCIDRFRKVVDEMKSFGYEMEMETYVKVLGRFCKRKMIKEAVDLYEFAMAGSNKPSVSCCTFLLRKLVVSKQLDMGLFSIVVRIFTESGNILTDSMVDAVLRSLTSVGRLGECNKVLKVMEEGGFVAGVNLQSKITFTLASAGKKDETAEFIDHVEASNTNLDHKA
ncbi:hypothetical protein CRYUN_Cryun24cG0031700 [Craigia yunnanensis]